LKKDERSIPRFIDLTEDAKSYGLRPSTAVQAKQLKMISDHNENLPPKKKAKETLPEISAVNTWRKDL